MVVCLVFVALAVTASAQWRHLSITGNHPLPTDVVGVWAAEARDYSYRANTCHGVCGHYTQLIWSDTREVGCAVARDASREVWVCNYDPPGNWVGVRPY